MKGDDLQREARDKAKRYFDSLSREKFIETLTDAGFIISSDGTQTNSIVSSVSFTIQMELSNRVSQNPTTYSLSA